MSIDLLFQLACINLLFRQLFLNFFLLLHTLPHILPLPILHHLHIFLHLLIIIPLLLPLFIRLLLVIPLARILVYPLIWTLHRHLIHHIHIGNLLLLSLSLCLCLLPTGVLTDSIPIYIHHDIHAIDCRYVVKYILEQGNLGLFHPLSDYILNPDLYVGIGIFFPLSLCHFL